MPFMDGLQMAEKIISAFPYIKIIFLTGYDDFHFAKKALHLKTAGYILKYEDNAQILQAVQQACSDLEHEHMQREKAARSKGLMENKFLSDLLAGIGNDELIQYEAELLNISFSGHYFCTAVISAKDLQRYNLKNHPDNSELLLFSIKNVCDEIFCNEEHRLLCVSYNQRINVLFNFATEDSESSADYIARILGIVNECIRTYLKISVTTGVGNLYKGYKSIPISYNEALMAAEMQGESGESELHYYEKLRNNINSHHSLLKSITDYIDRNYSSDALSLNEIADEVHISPTYVSTLFKKYKDINFSEYLSKIRMKKAAELLVNTDWKSYEIAEKVGYSNPQYFSVVFKRYFGYTPSEYKQLFAKP
jgi:two-component system response regulator YesN